ncbi:hypothetical protein BJ508DRAFT_312106 [Ascobolus immersus RN42]|uniref:Uncharacterized protein n=1 Tax=Ascobolus immersus RN42 TaxID=1160509 RepID=A0A3N4I064_ASCIM|nr:hypothetical protein BJ508DRAFT_312106 [Ascobolus immersus RN42]
MQMVPTSDTKEESYYGTGTSTPEELPALIGRGPSVNTPDPEHSGPVSLKAPQLRIELILWNDYYQLIGGRNERIFTLAMPTEEEWLAEIKRQLVALEGRERGIDNRPNLKDLIPESCTVADFYIIALLFWKYSLFSKYSEESVQVWVETWRGQLERKQKQELASQPVPDLLYNEYRSECWIVIGWVFGLAVPFAESCSLFAISAGFLPATREFGYLIPDPKRPQNPGEPQLHFYDLVFPPVLERMLADFNLSDEVQFIRGKLASHRVNGVDPESAHNLNVELEVIRANLASRIKLEELPSPLEYPYHFDPRPSHPLEHFLRSVAEKLEYDPVTPKVLKTSVCLQY